MIIKKKGAPVQAASDAKKIVKKTYVRAAEDDNFMDDSNDEEADGLMDAMDDIADNVKDLQDSMEDMEEDDVDIAMNNNIADHFIAECEECGGVFISAVVESDQHVDYVSGTCPLCGKESDQYLKWVIKAVES